MEEEDLLGVGDLPQLAVGESWTTRQGAKTIFSGRSEQKILPTTRTDLASMIWLGSTVERPPPKSGRTLQAVEEVEEDISVLPAIAVMAT